MIKFCSIKYIYIKYICIPPSISRAFSSSPAETLYPLDTNSPFYNASRPWQPPLYLLFYEFDYSRSHSSTLAWKIPWMEEPGRLQSTGSQRVGHDWATSLSLFTFMHWRRKWQPTPVFLPGESQGRGSLLGCHLWGRTSRTRLKRLSSSSRYLL